MIRSDDRFEGEVAMETIMVMKEKDQLSVSRFGPSV
jgi:hypothetical protein